MAKPVPPKRLYLEIPLEAWKRMKAECDRRRETLGGYVSISMLVTSMAYNLPKEKP